MLWWCVDGCLQVYVEGVLEEAVEGVGHPVAEPLGEQLVGPAVAVHHQLVGLGQGVEHLHAERKYPEEYCYH